MILILRSHGPSLGTNLNILIMVLFLSYLLGFNEETWRKYRELVLSKKDHLDHINQQKHGVEVFNHKDYKDLRHGILDFFLPHEFGGLGECKELKYQFINTFSKE